MVRVYHARDFLGNNFVSGLRTLKPKNVENLKNLKTQKKFSALILRYLFSVEYARDNVHRAYRYVACVDSSKMPTMRQ